MVHAVGKVHRSVVQVARSGQRGFECAAAAEAGKSFWRIMTNITLPASQQESVSSTWFILLFDLHLFANSK